jgi:hypothetical protein
LTLVTLDCGPFDIATSVSEVDDAVYSPAVLRLPGQSCGGKVKITQVRERRRCYRVATTNTAPVARRSSGRPEPGSRADATASARGLAGSLCEPELLEHAQVVVYGPVLDLFAVRESKDVDRGERMLPVPQTPNRGN